MDTLVMRLQGVIREHPHKAAYVFAGEKTTYGEFGRQIESLAVTLAREGVGPGDHVALILGNSPAFLISYFAVLSRGAVVIPINPTYTPDELAYILSDGDVKAVVALAPLVEQTQRLVEVLPLLRLVISVPYQGVTGPVREGSVRFLTWQGEMTLDRHTPLAVSAEDVAVVLYTSGTTGKPKGAMLTHRNLISNATSIGEYLAISESDRSLAVLPMFHVFCLTVIVNATLLRGATIVIMPRFSPLDVLRVVPEEKVSVFAGVPTMYNFLLQTATEAREYASALRHVRVFISGGASLPVPLLEAFEAMFECKVLEGYGLSEASPVTCFNPLTGVRKAGSIGQSIVNVDNKIVDELGDEVAVGEVGELIVRGPNVMKGYYKRPEETALTIRGGWLYTGDLAVRDEDGYFYIVDRKKDLILVGGYNVYPREVEEVLYEYPGIVEAAVVGTPDAAQGEQVKAYIVLREGVTSAEVRAHVENKLAKYKRPSLYEVLPELPRNTTGKILRTVLKRDALSIGTSE